MFCGIVETTGVVQGVKVTAGCQSLLIKPQFTFDDVKVGDSIAVNGVCLTITKLEQSSLAFAVVPESLRLTNLGQLVEGQLVNLERSMPLTGRIGGHCVQGHVDGLGEILALEDDGAALLATIQVAPSLDRYLIDKGYVTIDGMSITVIRAQPGQFTVTFIPHTQEVTILKTYKVGSKLNIEVDMMGKYLEKLRGVSA